MKIVVFGGSFNPLHLGHLFIAEEARTELQYEKVLFVPSSIPSHKEDNTGLKAVKRLEMLENALRNYDNYIVDDCDIKRGGISYSLDTINYVYDNYELSGKPGFIIGDDLLEGFSAWKNVEMLVELIDLIVVRRNYNTKHDFQYPCVTINNTVLPLSSTDIRERVRTGRNIMHLVPESVRIKIVENDYYRL